MRGSTKCFQFQSDSWCNGSYCTPGARREPPPGWNPTHAPTHPSPHHRLRRLGTGWVPYPSITHPSHHRLARRLGIPPAGYRLGTSWVPYPSITSPSFPPAGYRLGTLPIHHITGSAGWVPAGYRLGTLPIHHITGLPAGGVSLQLGTGRVPAGYPAHPSHHRLVHRLGTGRVPYPSITSPAPPAGYRLATGWVPYPSITSPACPSAGYPAGWVPAGYRLGPR
jgi:hypothetical protein